MTFSPTTYQVAVDALGNPVQPTSTALVTLTSSLTGQVIKGGPGRVASLSVMVALAGSGGVLEVWDNASAGSGTPLYELAVSNSTYNVAGQVIAIGLPAANGIYVTNASGTITSGSVVLAYS
jgi:hypothetical protein